MGAEVVKVLKSLEWIVFNTQEAQPKTFEYAVSVYVKAAIEVIKQLDSNSNIGEKQSETRTNAGYTITDVIHFGDEEFVLAELTNSHGSKQYVTWRCKNKTDYYWGHYFLSRYDALKNLCDRVNKEIDIALGINREVKPDA